MYANFLCTLSSITVAVRNIGVCASSVYRGFSCSMYMSKYRLPFKRQRQYTCRHSDSTSNRHRTLFYHNINPFIRQWQDCLPLVEKEPLTDRGKHIATKCHVLTGSCNVRPVLWTDSGNNTATRIYIHRLHYIVRCVNVPFSCSQMWRFCAIFFGRLWLLKG